MVFGRRKINCDVDIKINSNQITRVNKTKFLGIMIDFINSSTGKNNYTKYRQVCLE